MSVSSIMANLKYNVSDKTVINTYIFKNIL